MSTQGFDSDEIPDAKLSRTRRVGATVSALALAFVATVLALWVTIVWINEVVDFEPCDFDRNYGSVLLISAIVFTVEGLAGAALAWTLAKQWRGFTLAAGLLSVASLVAPVVFAFFLLALGTVCW